MKNDFTKNVRLIIKEALRKSKGNTSSTYILLLTSAVLAGRLLNQTREEIQNKLVEVDEIVLKMLENPNGSNKG